jgi:hypothetical protein
VTQRDGKDQKSEVQKRQRRSVVRFQLKEGQERLHGVDEEENGKTAEQQQGEHEQICARRNADNDKVEQTFEKEK